MLACSFATTAVAIEDWYMYVVFDGLDAPAISDDLVCYAPDGSDVWHYEAPNPSGHEWRWLGMGYSPLTRSVSTVSLNDLVIWRFDRLRGKIIDGLPNTRPELTNPVSLTVGPNGDIFVGNETEGFNIPPPPFESGGVQRYDGLTMTPLGRFVNIGSRGITFGPDGNLYMCNVAAGQNGRVFQIDGTTGAFLGDYIPNHGSQLGYPKWHNGDLYVTQSASNTILRISDGGSTIADFITPGDGGLFSPHGFVFTPDGDLLVSSRGFQGSNPGGTNAIKRYNGTTGAYIDDFASLPSDSRPSEVELEISPQADPANDFEVYVCTDGLELAPSDDTVYGIDSSGTVAAFDDPPFAADFRWSSIALGIDTNVYVTSLELDNVFRWNSADGSYLGQFTFASPAQVNTPDDLAFSPVDTNMYVACQSSTQGVARLDSVTGLFLDRVVEFSSLTGCTFGPSNLDPGSAQDLYITWSAGQIHAYDGVTFAPAGSTGGSRYDDLNQPSMGTFINEPKWHEGRLYLAQADRILYLNPPAPGLTPDNFANQLGEFVAAGAGGMTIAQGFDWDPNGDLLVASVGPTNGVRKFDGRTGEFLGMFAALSSDSNPTDLVVREFAIPVARPRLGISVASNLTIEVNFDSESGKTYDLQLEANLPAGTWTNDPTNEDIAGTGTNVVRTINSSGDAQNIRVKTD